MILADTSAWIEFLRGTGSPADQRIFDLLQTNGPLAVTEPVIMEVVGGARDNAQEDRHRRLLARCAPLGFDTPTDFDGAIRIYRRCRTVGVTPRGMIDCMIAAVAWRNRATLLAHDVDLARIADVIDIGLDDASLQTD